MDDDQQAALSLQYRNALLESVRNGRRKSGNIEGQFRELGLSDPVMADIRAEVQIELFSE
jgi:hypothetical protein